MKHNPKHHHDFDRHLVQFRSQAGLEIHVDGFYQIPTYRSIRGSHIPSLNSIQSGRAKKRMEVVWHCEAAIEVPFQSFYDNTLLPFFWNSVHMYVGELGVNEPLTHLVAFWYQFELLPWLPDKVKEYIQALDWHEHAVEISSIW